MNYSNYKFSTTNYRTPVLAALAAVVLSGCASSPNASKLKALDVQAFVPVPVQSDYRHVYSKAEASPFTGGAAIDINNDGRMEIFASGGFGQDDALLSLQGDTMVDIIDQSGLSSTRATYGATAIDFDDDGQTDLIIARDDGVWLYTNNGGRFTGQKIDSSSGATQTALNVAIADYDRDGDIDLYLSNFISFDLWRAAVFNDPDHIRTNILLRNDGNLNFTDVTEESGTAGSQNTFLSAFTDLDSDGYQDLVISNNTGVIEIMHNERDGTFTKNSFNSENGFWMGLGIGDYDNDGDQDLALSNASDSIPTFLVRGDLEDDEIFDPEWALLRNDGNRQFTNVAEEAGITGHGFGWGMVFEDLNLDGKLDLLAAQNYIKLITHKYFKLPGFNGLQVEGSEGPVFAHSKSLGLENKNFGQSAIIADLNGDARQDVTWINMGGPVKALINNHKADVVTLAVPDNLKWMGAEVTAISEAGTGYTRQVTNAVGMLTDQSPHLSFAAEGGNTITELQVKFADGTRQSIPAVSNTLIQP